MNIVSEPRCSIKLLQTKETILEDCLNAMKPILASENHHGSVSENNLFSIAEQNKITILEYLDNKLIYWSDNGFDVPRYLDDSLYNKPLGISCRTDGFLPKQFRPEMKKLLDCSGCILIIVLKMTLLKSGFEKEFRMS